MLSSCLSQSAGLVGHPQQLRERHSVQVCLCVCVELYVWYSSMWQADPNRFRKGHSPRQVCRRAEPRTCVAQVWVASGLYGQKNLPTIVWLAADWLLLAWSPVMPPVALMPCVLGNAPVAHVVLKPRSTSLRVGVARWRACPSALGRRNAARHAEVLPEIPDTHQLAPLSW